MKNLNVGGEISLRETALSRMVFTRGLQSSSTLEGQEDVCYSFVSVICYHAVPEKPIWGTNRGGCSNKEGNGQDSGIADLSGLT